MGLYRSNRTRNTYTSLGVACVIATAFVAGCAGAPSLNSSTSKVGPDRLARREQIVEEFDSHRTAAQLESARERWRQGDIAACQVQLEKLLRSDPHQVEARRLLADVYLVQQDTTAAADQLRSVLEIDETNDEAQHALGLLLMGDDTDQEASVHLRRAVELAPDNELYLSSLAALHAAQPSGAPQTARTSDPRKGASTVAGGGAY